MKPTEPAPVQERTQVDATRQKRAAERFDDRREHDPKDREHDPKDREHDPKGRDRQARRSWP